MNDISLYCDILPIHPPLEINESLTSYLIRLAQANRINAYSGIAELLFPEISKKSAKTFSNLPPLSVRTIATATRQTEKRILESTYYYLGVNFGRSSHPQSTAKFLNGAIKSTLRYCPECIKKNQYYSIFWDFNHIVGCEKHNIYLLEFCPNCKNSINPIKQPFRIGICPTCEFDLSKSPINELSSDKAIVNSLLINDLKSFLSSTPYPNHYVVGNILRLHRIFSQKSIEKIATPINIDKSKLLVFEVNKSKEAGGIYFSMVLQYVNALNIYFHQILTKPYIINDHQSILLSQKPSPNSITIQCHKEETNSVTNKKSKHIQKRRRQSKKKLLSEIMQEKQRMTDNNELITQTKFADRLHICKNTLYYYRDIRFAIMNNENAIAKNKEIDMMVKEIEKHSFEIMNHKKISLKVVAGITGISRKTLSLYEELVKKVNQLKKEQKRKNEDLYIHKAKRIFSKYPNISKIKGVISHLGIEYYQLKNYPQLRKYITTRLEEKKTLEITKIKEKTSKKIVVKNHSQNQSAIKYLIRNAENDTFEINVYR